MDKNKDNGDAPLALVELKPVLLEETYEWLEEADAKERAWNKIQQAQQMFAQKEAAPQEDDGKAPSPRRVQTWTSSRILTDGYGGYITSAEAPAEGDESYEEDALTVLYILSDHHWQGFGNQVWSASRHVANQLAYPDKCRQFLQPLFENAENTHPSASSLLLSSTSTSNARNDHPLAGYSVVELGCGTAIPSWTALQCGASRVVVTDQNVPGRIRCVAECAVRNWRENQFLKSSTAFSHDSSSDTMPCVVPYNWGTPVDLVLQALNNDDDDKDKTVLGEEPTSDEVATLNNEKDGFDVVIAADCCFMPWFYDELLQSFDMLLSRKRRGAVGILSFALHGNVEDSQHWNLIDIARDLNFHVEQIAPVQLTPQTTDMKISQALVHTLRLTRVNATN